MKTSSESTENSEQCDQFSPILLQFKPRPSVGGLNPNQSKPPSNQTRQFSREVNLLKTPTTSRLSPLSATQISHHRGGGTPPSPKVGADRLYKKMAVAFANASAVSDNYIGKASNSFRNYGQRVRAWQFGKSFR